ncbi:hypothetical protein J5N97_021620 [Dioscorea zingiberensis]|uniref:Uncharacterized protein n=1 Tax=Dioscorea zingiberensis TaxID=325984 RepID=A0A9D5C997_9LILI|nr:hypothetical protein J5N97_021620 [Dioscorea zingiberensis]
MEPDVAEFISAMAAGSGARVMVEVCAESAGRTTLALVAAAQQTGGRVVCVVAGEEEVRASVVNLGEEARSGRVELVVGDAGAMLGGADFVLVDCEVGGYESVMRAAEEAQGGGGGGVVVGYNALNKGGWGSGEGVRVDLLPIGTGLRVARVAPGGVRRRRRGQWQWVVRVDQCTGEEHVFRVRSPRRKWIEA